MTDYDRWLEPSEPLSEAAPCQCGCTLEDHLPNGSQACLACDCGGFVLEDAA